MERMKSNEMEREKYNAVPPTGKGLPGLWGLFFGGLDAELPLFFACSPNTDYAVIQCLYCPQPATFLQYLVFSKHEPEDWEQWLFSRIMHSW